MSNRNAVDLRTSYLGLSLKNPVVPSSGPFTSDLGKARQLEDAGASAIVMHSVFEEQLRHEADAIEHFLEHGGESFAEALSYFPKAEEYILGPEEYLENIRKLKETLEIPVIASLNGCTEGGWVEYARQIEQAGADALELNIYFLATDPKVDGREVEERYIRILQAVKSKVHIPVAVKLGPYFSAMANMAKRLEEAGANGLVLFNRFYQPDIDIERLAVVPYLKLSSREHMRLPLRWIAILYGRVSVSLAATSGIDQAEDVIKVVMAGADVAMVCGTLLRNGAGRIREILDSMAAWMEKREYSSLEQMKGSMSQIGCGDPAAFERANYMKALQSYK